MARYSVQPTDRIFIKGYKLLYFATNMGKNINKNRSRNVSSKYSQTDMLHNLQQMHLKLL